MSWRRQPSPQYWLNLGSFPISPLPPSLSCSSCNRLCPKTLPTNGRVFSWLFRLPSLPPVRCVSGHPIVHPSFSRPRAAAQPPPPPRYDLITAPRPRGARIPRQVSLVVGAVAARCGPVYIIYKNTCMQKLIFQTIFFCKNCGESFEGHGHGLEH